MRVRIYFEYPDGTEDYLILDGDDVEEIREKAKIEVERRGAKPLGSALIEE